MEALLTLRKLAKSKCGLFEIIMHEEASTEMFHKICDDPEGFGKMLAALIRGIDVESSQCSFDDEKYYILNFLERNLGTFDMLNCNLASIMEDWAFDVIRKMAEDIAETGDEAELASFRLCRAKIFCEWGRHEEALQQREMYLEWQFKMLDEHSISAEQEVGNEVTVASEEIQQCSVRTVAVADAMMAVAASYTDMNRSRDALKYQQEAQKYYKRVLHEDDLRCAHIIACIAQTYFNLDHGKQALQLLRSSIEFHRRVLPESDSRIYVAEGAIAAMHRCMQDFESALETEQRVLDMRILNLPDHHEDIGASHFSIALTLPFVASIPQPERIAGVLRHLESALREWKFSLEPSHPKLLLAKQKLAIFQESLELSVPDGSAAE